MTELIVIALGFICSGILIGLSIGEFIRWAFPQKIKSGIQVFQTPLETSPVVYVPENPVNFLSIKTDDELTMEEFFDQSDTIPTDEEIIERFSRDVFRQLDEEGI